MNAVNKPIGWGCLCVTVLALLAIGTLVIWAWVDTRRGWTVERLESLIAGEVPADANRQTVDVWFDAHAIVHNFWPTDSGDGVGNEEIAGFPNANVAASYVRGDIEGKEANVVVPDKSLLFQAFEGALVAVGR